MDIAKPEPDAAAADAGTALAHDAAAPAPRPFPTIRRVPFLSPLHWLARGLRTFRACPLPCLFYGVCFAAMGWIQASLLRSSPALMMALTCGFLLVGPFFAMGLYEVARRRDAGEACNLAGTTVAWRRNVSNIAILGIGLGVLMMLWARSSMMLIAIFFPRQMPNVGLLLAQLASGENLAFLGTYIGVGALFATLVFAFSAIAIPLMLDRQTDAITAMIASAVAVTRNLPAMLLWAALIVALTIAGFASLFVGLVVVVPLLGLATWHSYRDLVA